MADYGAAISLSRELSHTSSSSSSERSHRSVPTLSTTTPSGPLSSSSRPGGPRNRNGKHDADDHHIHMQSPVHVQRKPRGRPPGSKNKPKPPIIITKDGDSAMKPAILEISAGADVIETIINFARRNHVGISVMSATGSVSNVTLRHPVSHAPSLSLHGPFNILALYGSFVGAFATTKASSSSGSGNSGSVYSCSTFGISLAGAQGQVFGGIVAGKVVAAAPVVVVSATFMNPTFHRLPSDNDEVGETKPSLGGCGGSAGGANESCVSTGMSMSVYGVANPTPISCHMSSPDTMHWGCPPSCPPY